MRSVRVRLFAFTSAIVLLFAAAMILMNVFFLDDYYYWSTKNMLQLQAKKVTQAMPERLTWDTDAFGDIELSYNLNLIIYHTDGTVVYATDLKNFDATTQDRIDFNRLVRNVTQFDVDSYEVISETARFENQSITDGNIRYLALRTYLEDDYWAVIRVVETSMDYSAGIAGQFVWPICLAVLFICLIGCFIFARIFAKPIRDMNDITRSMSKFDFSRKLTVESHDEVGQLAESINILSDNTSMLLADLKQKNEQLRRDIDKERAMEKMRKEFVSNVSHELKTPIAIIQGYSEGLRLNVAGDAERRRLYCDIIESESYKMDRLVHQLLELSQLESGQIKLKYDVFDLTATLVSDIERIKSITDPADARIELTCDASPRLVYADEMRIGQVITNYINNAVSHAKGDKLVQVAVTEGDSVYRVSVFNSGDNISDEDISHLWESFYRADKARSRENGNYGLGLSIVRGIMNMHERDFGVLNVENGVVFWFDVGKVTQEQTLEDGGDSLPHGDSDPANGGDSLPHGDSDPANGGDSLPHDDSDSPNVG